MTTAATSHAKSRAMAIRPHAEEILEGLDAVDRPNRAVTG
jgi:hypothetical protein